MGLIRAVAATVGGTLSDQWLEAIEPLQMNNQTLMSKGVKKQAGDRGKNKGAAEVITDGSLIKVDVNQTMLLIDGGKIVDYSAEPGYYNVSNANAPSMFEGDFKGALSDAFNRFKFAGATPYTQKVHYVNTQEIPNIPFGTPAPIIYFDSFYKADLALRSNGFYSVRIVNPIKFYSEMASKDSDVLTIDEFKQSASAEFLTAFQTTIGKMAEDGVRISHISAKTMDLAKYMQEVLDEDWTERRGIEIVAVGINSITYDENSRRLINIHGEGSMLADESVRTGYMQGAVARGIESAGSNPGGAMTGFFGVGNAMNVGGGAISEAGQVNAAQAQNQPAPVATPASDSWICGKCNFNNTGGKFCANCGAERATVKFCATCGKPLAQGATFCGECGAKVV